MSRSFEMLRQAQRERELLNRAPSPIQTNSQNFEVLHLSGKDAQLFETTIRPAATQTGTVPPLHAGPFRGEAFKLIQQLFLAPGSLAPRALVFCAVEQGNDRNGICAKAGKLLASNTRSSVCVVDANVTSPYMHKYFGVENGPGFHEAMTEDAHVKNYMQQIGGDGLWLMQAGVPPSGANSTPAMTFERLAARMAELRTSFDHVLVDAPGAAGDSVAAYLSSLADGVILIVEQSFTPRQAVRDLKDEIEAAGGRVLGVVLHRRSLSFSDRMNSSEENEKIHRNS
jgi:protein-tyrosine kinase